MISRTSVLMHRVASLERRRDGRSGILQPHAAFTADVDKVREHLIHDGTFGVINDGLAIAAKRNEATFFESLKSDHQCRQGQVKPLSDLVSRQPFIARANQQAKDIELVAVTEARQRGDNL